MLEVIGNGSVVTWKHINLHGEYDFSDNKLQDSIGFKNTKITGFKLDLLVSFKLAITEIIQKLWIHLI